MTKVAASKERVNMQKQLSSWAGALHFGLSINLLSYTLCMPPAKALRKLHVYMDSTEPLLLVYAINTKIS